MKTCKFLMKMHDALPSFMDSMKNHDFVMRGCEKMMMFYDFLHATEIFKQKISVEYRISNEIQRKNKIY